MTSSPDRDQAIAPLPPALSSMWRLCKLGYRHEPRLMVTAFLPSSNPALILLLVYAITTVLTAAGRPVGERSAQEGGAKNNRFARHLFTIATTGPPGK